MESVVFELLLEVLANGGIAILNRIKLTAAYPFVRVNWLRVSPSIVRKYLYTCRLSHGSESFCNVLLAIFSAILARGKDCWIVICYRN